MSAQQSKRSDSTFSKPLLLMDICTIGVIKKRDTIPDQTDERKKNRLAQLTEIVMSEKYNFSFMLAIIEKASDVKNQLTAEEMTERFLDDHEMIAGMIGRQNIVESPDFLKNAIPQYMSSEFSIEERAELNLTKYLKLLAYYDTLNVDDKPKRQDVLPRVKRLAHFALALGLPQGHPVITVCTAALCGCSDAWSLLKRKRGVFKATNSLGDIMSFHRLAVVKAMIHLHFPCHEVIFRTEDQALENMHEYYSHKAIVQNDGNYRFHMFKLDALKMFPLLFNEDGEEDTEIMNEVYEMLAFKRAG
ncbi:hypothetical protein [Pantoea agglomerans]